MFFFKYLYHEFKKISHDIIIIFFVIFARLGTWYLYGKTSNNSLTFFMLTLLIHTVVIAVLVKLLILTIKFILFWKDHNGRHIH